MVGAFSVGAVVGAGKAVIDYASQLTDLSQKTGISTTGLQKLQLAFEQSGIGIDTVTNATEKLSKNLIGGDKGTIAALTKMGLSVQDLKKLAPEDLFTKVADAVGGIPNPTEKAFAAMTVFGKGGAELLAGLDGHLADTTKQFEAMGLVIDEETVKAADDFGDQMALLSKSLMAFGAQVLAPLLPGLLELAKYLTGAGQAAIELARGVENWLIKAFMQAGIAWDKFLLGIAKSSQEIPLLGKYLGASAETVAGLEENLRQSEDTLRLFSTTAEKTATTVKNQTAPALLGLGGDAEEAEKSAKKLHDELEKHTEAAHKVEAGFFGLHESVGKVDDSIIKFRDDVAKLTPELAKVQNTAHIANFGFKGMADGLESVGTKVRDLGPDIAHQFVGPLQEGAKSIGVFQQSFQGLIKGITGGNGIQGIFQNIGTGFIKGIGQMLSGGISSLISTGLNFAVKGIGSL